MAKATHRSAAKAEVPADQPVPAKRSWSRLRSPRTLVVLLGTTILGHALLLGFQQLSAGWESSQIDEWTVGEFQFRRRSDEGGRVERVHFQVHVSLVEELRESAGVLLGSRRYKVQQGIEELLREAHGGDFADPALTELKRRLQEKINQSLGVRAVSEVIITGLAVEPRQPSDVSLGPAPGERPLETTIRQQPMLDELTVKSPRPVS